jgi:hypothetical protein
MIAALLLRLGLSQRVSGILAWVLPVALFVAFVLGCIVLINRDANKRVADAVAADRDAGNVTALVIDRAASQSASANQQAADAQFRNTQDQAKEKTDEAARNRASPLDALFNELR